MSMRACRNLGPSQGSQGLHLSHINVCPDHSRLFGALITEPAFSTGEPAFLRVLWHPPPGSVQKSFVHRFLYSHFMFTWRMFCGLARDTSMFWWETRCKLQPAYRFLKHIWLQSGNDRHFFSHKVSLCIHLMPLLNWALFSEAFLGVSHGKSWNGHLKGSSVSVSFPLPCFV